MEPSTSSSQPGPSSSSATPFVYVYTPADMKHTPRKLKQAASVVENYVYEVIGKARNRGLFVKIPPCHPRAREIAEAIATYGDQNKFATRAPGCIKLLKQLVRTLDEIKMEEFNKRPGYKRLMNALKEEHDNYTIIAENRGLDEKGDLFQFIAHFPKLGHILKHVTSRYAGAPTFRYESVLEKLPPCRHIPCKDRKEWYHPNKTYAFVIPCKECLKIVIDKGVEKLDEMEKMMDKPGPAHQGAVIPEAHPFEKIFRVAKKDLSYQSSYTNILECAKKINGWDIESVALREKMFALRIRQQKLTAMSKIYRKNDYTEEWESVGCEIDETSVRIVELNEMTAKTLTTFRDSLNGSFERVRTSLGTPSGIFLNHPSTSELNAVIDTQDDYIRDLEGEIKRLKAKIRKNATEEGPAPAPTPAPAPAPAKPTKVYRKRDRDDDEDYKPHKRDRDYKPAKKTYGTTIKRARNK